MFIFVFVSLVILQSPADALDKIRIGFAPGASSTPLPLAQRKGFMKEEDLDAEIIRMSSMVAAAALGSGEADYAIGMSALRGAIQGLPLRAIASYMQGSTQTLIARSDIKTVANLRGKTITIGTPGGSPDRHARLMVSHFGLQPDRDVKFAAGGLTEGRLARLQQGLIDATVVPVPLDLQAKKLGLNVLARAYEIFTYPEGGLVTTTMKMLGITPSRMKSSSVIGIGTAFHVKHELVGKACPVKAPPHQAADRPRGMLFRKPASLLELTFAFKAESAAIG